MNGIKFVSSASNFSSLPGNIFCYWLSDKIISYFHGGQRLADLGTARQGMSTSDNNRFLRFWYEVSIDNIAFDCHSCTETKTRPERWYPYNKAGFYRKWSSINEYVVNYKNDGEEIKKTVMEKYPYLAGPGFVVKNTEWYFKHGISWNDVATGTFCARYIPDGFAFADAAPTFFSEDNYLVLGFFNSKVFQIFADIICQGLHYSTGHIPAIPYLEIQNRDITDTIADLSAQNIALCQEDWDAFETSWNFKRHPLLPHE